MNTTFQRHLIAVCALSIFLIAGSKMPAAELPGAPDQSGGVKVLIIGHSLTGNLYALPLFAPEVGHPAHHHAQYSIIGAGIEGHYKYNSTEWRENYFAHGQKWDALVMSARNPESDAEFAPKFAAEAFRNNPKCQVFIYGNWPELTESFEKPEFRHTEAHIENVAAAVDKAFPNAPRTRLIPCSLVIRELGRMADRGELPGVGSRFELFADYAHPSRFTSYALNVLVMSMLYNEPPWNYPADIYQKGPGGIRQAAWWNIQVPEETATVIKRVVWDILQTYPPALMPPSLLIANRTMEPVIAGQSYKAELKALHAVGPCVWSIVKGKLPDGLFLTRDGVLEGKSEAVGDYPLTLKLAAGKESFERLLVLRVCQDVPPVIPDQPMETVALDQYVTQPLVVKGGVGPITWSLAGGTLPYGIRLSPAGMLVGSPGEEGQFTFKIKAEDSHPGGPCAAEKEFKWKIRPARPDTLKVKYLITKGWDFFHVVQRDPHAANWEQIPKDVSPIDGTLNEPFWDLSQSIEKKVNGMPTKKAVFSAVWTGNCNGYSNKPIPTNLTLGRTPGRVWTLSGDQLVLGVKVLDGPKGKTLRDGVHIFIDGNHNRSAIYAGDDTHFFISRFQKAHQYGLSIRGKVNWFLFPVVREIEGGYTMEITLWGNDYFSGEGNWLPFGYRGVYGLDVAVDEGDDDAHVSQQVWRGDANDAEDTSHFGTIVLTGQPAMTPQPTRK